MAKKKGPTPRKRPSGGQPESAGRAAPPADIACLNCGRVLVGGGGNVQFSSSILDCPGCGRANWFDARGRQSLR